MKRQAARGEPLEKQEASRWTGLECKWIFDRDSNKRRASRENVVERTLDASLSASVALIVFEDFVLKRLSAK